MGRYEKEFKADEDGFSNTQYNMYMGVVTMFFYLVKFTAALVHCLYPILSLLLHIALLVLWAVSIHVQTAPDTIDPHRENHGAPWYITKNCNVEPDHRIRGYCTQAKASFAISCCMLYVHLVSFHSFNVNLSEALRADKVITAVS